MNAIYKYTKSSDGEKIIYVRKSINTAMLEYAFIGKNRNYKYIQYFELFKYISSAQYMSEYTCSNYVPSLMESIYVYIFIYFFMTSSSQKARRVGLQPTLSLRMRLIYHIMSFCVYWYRGASPAAGHRDTRWAGLVSGTTRDTENSTLCQRDGFK